MSSDLLSGLDLVRGFTSLVFVIMSLIIGIKIILKYFEYKQKVHIAVGLAWIFLSSSWWHAAFNFISLWFFNAPINNYVAIFMVNGFISPAVLCWMYSVTTLLYERLKREIMIPSLIIFGLYEIIFLILLFVNPNLVGIVRPTYIVDRTLFTLTFTILAIIIALIMGFLLSFEALGSSDVKIKWKGRFLLIAFILFTLGAILDSFSWTEFSIIFLIRTLLIISVVSYYFGFFLPESIARLLIKDIQ
ncbi:MAG: conserved membrane protein of unknown function [Promethearchaeota archaeon]|nr:MAG: conserved membrane protein of unknown function [Candidatus Lokiarchaeota archaeon]